MLEMFNRLVAESPLVEGGLALMIAGWLGYQVRAVPERIIDLFRVRLTRVV